MIFGALDFGSLTRVAQTDPGFLKFTTAAPDTQAPSIVNVAIPNVPMKIGDIVTATITVAADSDSLMLGAGSKIGGYTLGNLHKVNATTYTATFIITEGSADVAAGADLPVNVVLVDSADNISPPYTAAIAQASDAIDATVPTVSVAADKFVLKAGETATITFTFSEDPGSSFTSGSVAVSGGTLSAISGTGLTRTATFTPTTNVNNGTASISVINKSYSDVAGNGGAASLGISLTYDTLRPTLTIVCNKPSLKAGDTATITFTFSEDPGSSFGWDGSTGDLTVSGGTLSAISGTGTTCTATFTPAANTNGGMASISVQGSTYQDAKGNTGASASLSFGFDTQAPNAPSAPELAAEDDSGTFNDDNVTNSNTATFSGTAENGTTVRLYDGATEIAHTTVTNGTYWITLTGLSTTLAGLRNRARAADVFSEGLSAGGRYEHLSCVGA